MTKYCGITQKLKKPIERGEDITSEGLLNPVTTEGIFKKIIKNNTKLGSNRPFSKKAAKDLNEFNWTERKTETSAGRRAP